MSLHLISHELCPYVQRVAIALAEKNVDFVRRDIDLGNKPTWFLAISPLGKTPVLQDGNKVIFESAVILEYLEETQANELLPPSPHERALHRGFVEMASACLNDIARVYSTADEKGWRDALTMFVTRLEQVEKNLSDEGPWFAGESFGIVDAAFAPVFRYFEIFEGLDGFPKLEWPTKISRWRQSLATRGSVIAAVSPHYASSLRAFLARKDSHMGRLARSSPVTS